MTSEGETPTVYVVAGPNGAGKTTFASEFLPEFVDCREFLNADLIAAGLSPFAPDLQNLRAGRLLLERFKELSSQKQSFGLETTLAGRTTIRRLTQLRTRGYQVLLFFLWLPNTSMAISRVANRVLQGGHDIPQQDIRRRFESGLRNFFQHRDTLADSWWFYDASRLPPNLIASEENGVRTVIARELFKNIQRTVTE